jgi:hypothetical protein
MDFQKMSPARLQAQYPKSTSEKCRGTTSELIPRRNESRLQQQEEKMMEARTAVERLAGFLIRAATVAVIALLAVPIAGPTAYAQEKYTLQSPGGISFSDFRGYEDWAVVSSARTDQILKVIVANPAMIKAFKTGVPGNGRTFPDGSMIVKLQWTQKKSTEAPFAVDVPDAFSQAFVMEKDSKRFAASGGWGYAVFNYDPPSDKFSADAKSPSNCGYACHTPVKAKDYIYHPYEKR